MKTAASIIIVVAALIFAFFLGRSSYTPEPPKVVEKWLTKYDTVEYRDTVKIPVPQVIVRDTTIYLPGEIDTAALLADYLARKEYPLDFSNDSIGEFRVDITVQRNTLIYSFVILLRNIIHPLSDTSRCALNYVLT